MHLKSWLRMVALSHFHNREERKRIVESSCSFCEALNLTVLNTRLFSHYTACLPSLPFVSPPFPMLLLSPFSITSLWLAPFSDALVFLLTMLLFLIHRNQLLSWGYFHDAAVTSAIFNNVLIFQSKRNGFEKVVSTNINSGKSGVITFYSVTLFPKAVKIVMLNLLFAHSSFGTGIIIL